MFASVWLQYVSVSWNLNTFLENCYIFEWFDGIIENNPFGSTCSYLHECLDVYYDRLFFGPLLLMYSISFSIFGQMIVGFNLIVLYPGFQVQCRPFRLSGWKFVDNFAKVTNTRILVEIEFCIIKVLIQRVSLWSPKLPHQKCKFSTGLTRWRTTFWYNLCFFNNPDEISGALSSENLVLRF